MGYSFCAYSFFSGIIICSMTAFGTTDCGSITWYDPPAVETVKDPAIISSVNKSLIKGSISEELNCDFSLSKDLRLITVSMKFGITPVATYLRSQQALSVTQRFRSRFNATWVPNRLTLILLNATSTDEGEYICEVVTFGRSVYTWVRKIQVSLLVPPSISEITGKTVIEGGNVTLKCLAEGKPTPSITWTRLSDNSVVTMPLINISRHDVREYRSTADNGVGTPATRDVTIDVQFPPTIAEISGSQTVIEGENVTLKCLADGKPTPNITWTRLSDNSVVSMILTYISRQDAGKYRCTADNRMGSPATGDVLIIVQYPVEAKGFGENATVLEGSAKNFSCPVDGNPKPKITWYKGSEVSGKPICYEEKLEARESGCYTCAASNFLGQSVIITQCL